MFGPDDDEDFAPAGKSKLAALFGQPMEEGNVSLTYTAPKQPKKTRLESASSSSGSSGKLSIIVVQAVHTYKLEDGNYVSQGKLGVALIGNIPGRLYQLLIYKNKQQHVTSSKITDKFQFVVQAQNFVSFYDDKGQNWSIMFDSESHIVDFAREVGLARACVASDKEQQPFYVQDLKAGEGPGAEEGDLLDIRYTTLPLINGKLEKAIENNVDADKPQRVNIRKGVWEEALLGATKGSKRMIVLAPDLFGPWKPLADASHRLVVEVEVGRIKTCKRNPESKTIHILNCPDSSESNVDSSTEETSIKARGASISEALTNSPKTNKASIISRMARMGQATLPLKGAIVCNPSDSEETEEESSGGIPNLAGTGKPMLKPRSLSAKRSLASLRVSSPSMATSQDASATSTPALSMHPVTASSNLPGQQISVYQTAPLGWSSQSQPAQYIINGMPVNLAQHPEGRIFASQQQVLPVPAVLPTPSGTPCAESQMAVFYSENRTHNAEVRMGLSKITDKVDQILGKLDSVHQPPVTGLLEPRSLLASIQKLVLDNEQLQAELADKRIKLEQQNEKMYQLLQHKFLEQSTATSSVDQRQDGSYQMVILGLQQEKEKLSLELSDAVTKINALQIQATKSEHTCLELHEELKNMSVRLQATHVELHRSKQALIEQESLMRSLKEKTDASVNLHDTQDSVINDLEMKVRDLLAAKTLLENTLTDSKNEFENLKMKMSEEISLMEAAHKEEKASLEMMYREQLNEAMKNSIKSTESECLTSSELSKIGEENKELKSEVSDLKSQLAAVVNSSMEDIKKVMNVMFKLLKSEFTPGTSYDGATIRETILSSIQNVTLQYMKMKTDLNNKITSGDRVTDEKKLGIVSGEKSTSVGEKVENSVKGSQLMKKLSDTDTSKSVTEEEKKNENRDKKDRPISKSTNGQGDTSENLENAEKTSTCDENDMNNASSEKVLNVIEPKTGIKVVVEETNTESKGDVSEEQINMVNEKEHALGSNLQAVKPRESSVERGWRPQPPPSPLFDDEEDDDDDWLS